MLGCLDRFGDPLADTATSAESSSQRRTNRWRLSRLPTFHDPAPSIEPLPRTVCRRRTGDGCTTEARRVLPMYEAFTVRPPGYRNGKDIGERVGIELTRRGQVLAPRKVSEKCSVVRWLQIEVPSDWNPRGDSGNSVCPTTA